MLVTEPLIVLDEDAEPEEGTVCAIVKRIESPLKVPVPPETVKKPRLMLVGALTSVLGWPVNVTVAPPLASEEPERSGPESVAEVEYVTVVANAETPQKRRVISCFFICCFNFLVNLFYLP